MWTFVLKIAVSENNGKFARSCPFSRNDSESKELQKKYEY